MCILGLQLLGSGAGVPFVCVHNRDEYFDRPVAPLDAGDDGVIFGKDLKGGGTWMGYNWRTGEVQHPDAPLQATVIHAP